MEMTGITGIQELSKNLLEISVDFFNINKLSECLVSGEKCNGCHTLMIKEQDMLIKKACRIVSKAISVLTAVSQTLLSSDCILKEEKITLADKIRILSCDIKIFLLTRSHILSSYSINGSTVCDCNNHKNIMTLSDIFISVIDIK